ncbi:hypothetical protein C8J57DRAFT_1299033 [Mycena rebaudengoi]|nr:hypothetical protein C8J57DRAFT_1299033 [Mycena rebaudengoi]
MYSPYSAFFDSGLHASAAAVYTYTHPHDDDDGEHPSAPYRRMQAPRSPPPMRKRRSSITTAASPMNNFKLARSPARAAGNAWHMANVVASSPSRSRSSSVATNVASEETSMLGRIRSNSIDVNLRLRRKPLTRRNTAFLAAPALPPPTAPLPALPLHAPATKESPRTPLLRLAMQPPADVFFTPASPVPSSPSAECYLPGGVWMGQIDEEMKEN